MATPGAHLGSDEEALNSLLRGERSAVETFEQALGRFAADHAVFRAELARIREEHAANVRRLEEAIRRHGGEPATSSGPWGSFVAVVTGAAVMLGPHTTLAALRAGEEHGLADYQSVLDNPRVGNDVKATVREVFLPAARQHVARLTEMGGQLAG